MSRVRITLDITAEPGTDWRQVLDTTARAAADATTGECVILIDARPLSARRECRRPRVWPVWS